MTRWSLSNYFRKTSHAQFSQLTAEFKQACETAFGTECALDIRLLSRPKVFTTFWLDDDAQESINEANRRAEILRTENLDDVTKEQWDSAAYVEVGAHPINTEQSPDHAFGHAEFKGILSKTATFYMQGGNQTKNAATQMVANHKWMLAGDGFDSNGQQSATGLMSVAGRIGMPSSIVAGILSKGRKNFTL